MNSTPHTLKTLALEWHQLDLRYQTLRIHTAQARQRLMLSMDTHGLITPIVVIAAQVTPQPSWIVIDGYLRIAALQALGKDKIDAVVWELPVPEALLSVYKNKAARAWEPLEEAHLLQELLTTYHYSQATCAKKLGKSGAWLSSRLQLLQALPDFVKEAIYQGAISSWSAARILVPFARANAEHAQRLVHYSSHKKCTSRELYAFYTHYLRANPHAREQMTLHCELFFKAHVLKKSAKTAISTFPPHQLWESQLAQLSDCLNALESLLPVIFYPQQSSHEQEDFIHQLDQIATHITTLRQTLRSKSHAQPPLHPNHSPIASSRQEHT